MAAGVPIYEVTGMFPARYNGICELEGCHTPTVRGQTILVGVEVFSQETQDFQRKPNDKPFWIHASHYMEIEEEMENDGQDDGQEETDNIQFREVTQDFTASYNGRCQLPGCHRAVIANMTELIGVEIYSEETLDFEPNYNGKPYWICASHCLAENMLEDEDDEVAGRDEGFNGTIEDNNHAQPEYERFEDYFAIALD